MRKLIIACSFLSMLGGVKATHAQLAYTPVWKRIREANNFDKMSYDYEISLIDLSGKSSNDTIRGKLYKDHDSYLDSTKQYLTAVSNGYFYQVYFDRRSITAYNIKALQKRMNIRYDGSVSGLLLLEDSVLSDHNNITVTKKDGRFIVDMAFTNSDYRRIKAELSEDHQILRMEFETVEKDGYGDPSGYIRRIVMDHIRYDFNEKVIDNSRFFTVSGNKIAVSQKYSGYKLNALTN